MKNRKKGRLNRIFAFLLLIGLALNISQAQDTETLKKPVIQHELGAGAGFTTGIGLSYRAWKGKYGIQITFLPIIDEYSAFISTGVTGLLKIRESEMANFYLFLGNHFIIDKYEDDFTRYDYRDWNLGIGPGFEVVFFETVSFNLMFGYALYDFMDKLKTNFTVEIGMFYKF